MDGPFLLFLFLTDPSQKKKKKLSARLGVIGKSNRDWSERYHERVCEGRK